MPHGLREIHAGSVLGLYRAAGWWPARTAEQVRAVLGTSPAVGAWHGQSLAGFARAVTDGILRAYVEDMVVAPDWRGMGIGPALLAGLMEQSGPVPVVTLFCSPDLVRYYEAGSFRRSRQVVMHRAQRAARSWLGLGLPGATRWGAEAGRCRGCTTVRSVSKEFHPCRDAAACHSCGCGGWAPTGLRSRAAGPRSRVRPGIAGHLLSLHVSTSSGGGHGEKDMP